MILPWLYFVCSTGHTAVNIHRWVTQIFSKEHPETLPHQVRRVVTTKSYPLTRPHLDIHADVLGVARDVEFWTGELQRGAVDRIFIGSLAVDLVEVRKLLELELIARVHDHLPLGQTVLADHVHAKDRDKHIE